MGPVRVCGPRPGKSVRVFLICSIVVPGTTWLWLCIMVSRTTVSLELTRSTGGWALSNQPHWVVSRVAGSKGTLLSFGRVVVGGFGGGGPAPGVAGGVDRCGRRKLRRAAGAGDGGVCASVTVVSVKAT